MRTIIKDIPQFENKEITLKGWVHDLRDLAKIKFLILRDYSGITQCIIKSESLFKTYSSITLESIVELKGKVNKAKIKSPEITIQEYEIEVTELTLINKSERIPIKFKEKEIDTMISKRLDYRYLDIRNPKIRAIFKIQAVIAKSFRDFFYDQGFIEIQPPAIISASSEGGTELFPVKYFEKQAYLAQSPQLYKQLMACSLERVWGMMPIWRAEKHNTPRHLNEIRQMDMEAAFIDDIEVMKIQEKCVQYIVKQVIECCEEDLELLELKLKIPKAVYLTYKETLEILNKNKLKLKDGEDLTPEAEKKLSEIYPDHLIFVYEWPIKIKPFYIWPKDEKNGISGGFDSIYNGTEISSGGQRIHDPDILIKSLKLKGLKPKDFEWYIDSFRFGAPIHSGWSIGLERMTMTLLKLQNIREACLFPRDRDRLTP